MALNRHPFSSRAVIVSLLAIGLSLGHWAAGPLRHSTAWADVPKTITYQGKLTEPDGSPLTGEHQITLRLYDAASGGSKLWEEQHTITLSRIDNGVFSILLGSRAPFGSEIRFNDPLWLTIEVDGGGEFSPRQALSAVGYAINADTLDGLDSSQFLGAVHDEHGALPPHASTHQPGGADALPTGTPVSIGTSNSGGTSTSLARADHLHEGLHTIAASGQPQIRGDAILAAGSNVTLSQAGQTITIAAAGAGSSGNRVTTSASNAVTVGTASDTTLLSVAITKSQAGSALLILATVELSHSANPAEKTVDVKLFRDATQLDASYTVRLGTTSRSVSDVPVSLHAWDAPGAGTYTVSVRARASGAGTQATIRRLTVIEL